MDGDQCLQRNEKEVLTVTTTSDDGGGGARVDVTAGGGGELLTIAVDDGWTGAPPAPAVPEGRPLSFR